MKKLIFVILLSTMLFSAGSVYAIKLPFIPYVHEEPDLIIPQKKSVVQNIIPQVSATSEPEVASSTIVLELGDKISEQDQKIEELKEMLLKLIAELQRQINDILNQMNLQ